jgi:hypothetical protein
MFVKISPLLIAGLLCFGFSGGDNLEQSKQKGEADWTPKKLDAVMLAQRAERSFKTFNSVACGVILNYKVPFRAAGATTGKGYLLMNEYFWSPSKFRIEYMDSAADKGQVPSSEFVAVNGAKKMRLGQHVPASGTKFSSKQGVFDVSSDAALVELWPTKFSKYLFSPFVGGNATLSRYVRALKKGVGGYTVTTYERSVTLPQLARKSPQYRILANRSAQGKRPASRVEIIFFGEAPYLPITIATTYGPMHERKWSGQWLNKVNLTKMDPFKIAPTLNK